MMSVKVIGITGIKQSHPKTQLDVVFQYTSYQTKRHIENPKRIVK